MKKIFSLLILLIFLLLKPMVFVYGQSINFPLPGVNCGIANSTDASQSQSSLVKDSVIAGSLMPFLGIAGFYLDPAKGEPVNRCCTAMDSNVNNFADGFTWLLDAKEGVGLFNAIGGLLTNIPGVGLLFSGLSENLSKFRVSYRQLQEYQKQNPGVACVFGTPDTSPSDPQCTCVAKDASNANRPLAQMCYTYLSKSNELGSCVSCAAAGKMWTAIGCIPTNFQSFVSDFLLSTGIGLGGIAALLCIIYSAFMMQTSRGNPEKIKKAQENLTSCILGLMLIIFSVFILQLIGVKILKIPFITTPP